jgi:hypothetical protein
MASFDLRSYLDRFPEVCERKFVSRFDFAKLEKEFEPLRTGGRWLTARDVAKIFEKDRTPFAHYWQQPDRKLLARKLTEQPILMSALAGDGRELAERLVHLFHSLGTASLVLRMVHPERFGVFSTPIVHLLQIHRENTVDLYMAYCEELHVWEEHFGLPSVAQTEMALWVYHELTAPPLHGTDVETALREFESDVWIQRRRIAQDVTPFLKSYGQVELAEILCECDPRLAAIIAGVEFERRLRVKWRAACGKDKFKQKKSVDEMINDLAEHAALNRKEASRLIFVWKTRNKAVHPDPRLSYEEVEEMIICIKEICFDWEA